MPYGNNPHDIILYFIEEPIRLDDYFTKGEIGELGKESARFGK